ncbi:GNAT family N-acetyltransferase [uncultured Eudoraea sp.]|uniref:GNAT family N-acetyltransferase n=1 Tax=uncultured Eudoraea sp. TaxID=1035614 RepID=UPI0026334C39|nr:GNAT family N-acetyltransferase [uncultured Eudoraea sp.]
MNLLLEGEESNRLIFRKVSKTDFNAWLPFHQEPLSSQYFAGEIFEPKAACQNWFTKVFTRYENNLGGLNALINKESGLLIGMCGLLIQTVDEIQELEIGYSILPEYWKKGYASEAAKKCKAYALEHQLADSIISIIHIDNIGSQKVALNNGMHPDKTTTYKGIPVHIFRSLL